MRDFYFSLVSCQWKNGGPELSSDVSRLTKKYDNFKLT